MIQIILLIIVITLLIGAIIAYAYSLMSSRRSSYSKRVKHNGNYFEFLTQSGGSKKKKTIKRLKRK